MTLHNNPLRRLLPPGFPGPDRPHVKVCGLRRAPDAIRAIELGAAFIGLIFAEESPRRLSREEAVELLRATRAAASGRPVRPIGVFVHEPAEEIASIARELRLTAVQVHRPIDPADAGRFGAPVLRAVRVRGPESAAEIDRALAAGPVLLDAFVEGRHGGTGRTFDHRLAAPYVTRGPVFIAGGLNPDNIGEVARSMRGHGGTPYAFDASSGLEEAPGVKSPGKMERFFAALGEALAEG